MLFLKLKVYLPLQSLLPSKDAAVSRKKVFLKASSQVFVCLFEDAALCFKCTFEQTLHLLIKAAPFLCLITSRITPVVCEDAAFAPFVEDN